MEVANELLFAALALAVAALAFGVYLVERALFVLEAASRVAEQRRVLKRLRRSAFRDPIALSLAEQEFSYHLDTLDQAIKRVGRKTERSDS